MNHTTKEIAEEGLEQSRVPIKERDRTGLGIEIKEVVKSE